jgi:PPOX class probable F420-dependent enzyme
MPASSSDVALLKDPIAQELLSSTIPAQLAYVWHDGTPRVVPIWIHWNGSEVVMGTPPKSPKVKAIARNPAVQLTINGATWPYKVLQIRGTAKVTTVDGISPEYAAAARRYFGEEAGKAWCDQVGGLFAQMAQIRVRPERVSILDFETRFPSEIAKAMAGAGAGA